MQVRQHLDSSIALQNVFSYYRMCSLTTECVLLLQVRQRLDSSIAGWAQRVLSLKGQLGDVREEEKEEEGKRLALRLKAEQLLKVC